MDSTFIYPVTIHRGAATGSLTANWVTALPSLMNTPDERVAVLYSSEGKFQQGLYLKESNSTRWRFVLPYSEICIGIIDGLSIDVYYGVTTPNSGLPSTAKIWRNGVETDDPTFTVNDNAVYGALSPTAGSGQVNSVNGVRPDGAGNVAIGIPQIPGLTAALASAGSVKTVNAASPDVNGNVTVPVATATVAGTVKGGGNVTIALDGTLNAPASPVVSVSGQVGAVVIEATNNNAASGTTLISDSGATTGNIKLKTIAPGTNIGLTTDANGNLQVNNTYALPIASATVLGGVKQGSNVTIAGDGTLSVAAPYVLPIATTTTLGGVIVQGGLTVDGSGNLSANVLSFNARTGSITLQLSDVTNVGGAPLASPVFNGTPTAPTPASGDNSTNIATTAFVAAAVAAGAAGSIATFEFIATSGQTVFPATFASGAAVEVFQNGGLLLTTDYSTNGGVGPVTLNTGATLSDEVKIIATAPFNVANVVPVTGGSYTGVVEGLTAAPGDNSTQFATTAFVDNAISAIPAGVTSFNTRTGTVTLQLLDVTGVGGAPLVSPTFTGTVISPTPTAGDNSTKVATTAFVATSFAPLASPALTGTPTSPTATAGTNTTQIATTAFVTSAIGAIPAGVASFNTRTGAVTLQLNDVTGVGGAPLASPTFTGTVAAPTPTAGDSSTKVATTAFVATSFAPLASPALTGTPTAPTATAGTNTTQLATTAFVTTAVAAGTAGVTSFNTRTGAVTLQATDVSGVGGALLASPTFTGAPAAPTAATGNNSTTLATTNYVYGATQGQTSVALTNANVTLSAAQYSNPAIKFTGTLTGSVTITFPSPGNWNIYNATTGAFTVTLSNGTGATVVIPQANTLGILSDATAGILSASSSGGAVTSVAGRTGAIVLAVADVSGAAPLASPALTGTPTSTTPTAGDSSTKVATTAFVATSFAPLASPALTGTPTAPTATAGTNTTQIATTAFVTTAVAGGVTSFNTRTGAVTLVAGDVTGAGGALLASPTFTGVPAAPTATAGTSTTQLATTAFVATSFAPLASPALTGTPTAPTATTGTNNTQLATTNYVYGATQGQTSVALTNANVTLSAAQYSNPAIKFTGTLTGSVTITFPTTGNWSIYNATTGAFTITLSNGTGATVVIPQANTLGIMSDATAGILSSSSSGGAVTSVAGRTGAITLAVADVSGAAPLASPTFTGTPAAPTATAGTSTTQVATTAFVATSFAPLASPALTGTPTVPTASAGTNTTQAASAAFVYNATQATGSVALTNANVTLSSAQYGNAIINFTGTLTANVVITFPTTGLWTLFNNTTGAFTVTVSNGSGATFTLPQGNTMEVVSSGSTGMQAASTASPVRFQSPAYSYTVTALGSVSGTQTLNLGTASEFTMTITGATTIAFTNTLGTGQGEVVYIRFTNAGSAAITWPASTKFAAATAPTFTASGVDMVGVKYDTTTSTYMVFVIGLAIA